ncbi:hypothetical protein SAMN06296010_1816 [Agreia pratensis]|uniref:Uncharacterized protein n=2 Tax=Agreia pratensis TaxID=150121 RepID=A0A1X7JTE9_9MICO|nr:hypothetical protein SAMN06296010_1816 [Agreia pratensis]
MSDPEEMKRMSYAGGTFVTSDEVADALVHFVAIVPRNRRNQVVIVPGFDAGGTPSPVALVLGPTSQIMSQHEAVSYAEPETQGVADRVREQARSHENTARIDSSNGKANLDYDVF